MLKKDLILRNPLRLLGHKRDDILSDGQFGAVLARAGVGKTAFLVQLALNSLLRDNNVLHVSLNDPVDKVVLWYRAVIANITKQYNARQVDQLWEAILPHRFIMTFKVDGFSVPRLEERLNDLTEQGIFIPRVILIDGFVFDESKRDSFLHLKELAKSNHIHVWFAVRTHRSEKSDPGSIPPPLAQMAEMFEVAIQLQPEGDKTHVKALKGVAATSSHPELLLDPSTMLIRNKS